MKYQLAKFGLIVSAICISVLTCNIALAQPDPFGDPDLDLGDPFGGEPVPVVDPSTPDVKPAKPVIRIELAEKPDIEQEEVRSNEAVFEALKQTVNIEMSENSIDELANAIHHQLDIPVHLDINSIRGAFVNPENRFLTFKAKETPLYQVLGDTLREKRLTFTAWNGALWFTGIQCEKNYRRVIYDISELVSRPVFEDGVSSKTARDGGSDLRRLVQSSVLPTSWRNGHASIASATLGSETTVLVVVQTTEAHLRITEVIDNLKMKNSKKPD